MIPVIDVLLDYFSNLFRSHKYSPLEKIYSVILFIAGLSLRDLSERLCLTCASRESVRIWVHRFSSLFKPSKRARRLVAVDETVLKVKGQICYLWAAIDVDTNEILAVYASRGRGIPNAIKFLKMVLRSCDGKSIVVVDRGPWYRWVLERLGITYFPCGNRNKIERWFRELKNRTKRFYNNVNSKTLKSIEEIAIVVAIVHNLVRIGRG
jgi:putative transposase